MMKLSEAIREGGKKYAGRQAHHALFHTKTPGGEVMCACALGAAVAAVAPEVEHAVHEEIRQHAGYSNVDYSAALNAISAGCGVDIERTILHGTYNGRLVDFVTHLNDGARLTFDEIAMLVEEEGY